jgi:hypothetical protein
MGLPGLLGGAQALAGRQGLMCPEPLNKPLFGLKAIAAHCGVSVNILRKWIREEKFPAAKDPRWMSTTAKIAEWVGGKVGV